MHITLVQAILIGLWAGFCLAGQLWGIYTNRSLVLALGVGIILGDIPTALTMGAVSELAFMGFGVGAGGTVPPNQLGPGIVGTLLAITLKNSGMDVKAALALSIPFAVAFQFLITAAYTLLSGTTASAKKALEKGNYKLFAFYGQLTLIVFFVIGFAIGFGAAINTEGAKYIIQGIPQWLIKGFSVAGGLLPAIGFAFILNVMAKKEFLAFVFLGFVSVAFLKLPVMGVALIALVFALYDFSNKTSNSGKEQEEYENGI